MKRIVLVLLFLFSSYPLPAVSPGTTKIRLSVLGESAEKENITSFFENTLEKLPGIVIVEEGADIILHVSHIIPASDSGKALGHVIAHSYFSNISGISNQGIQFGPRGSLKKLCQDVIDSFQQDLAYLK